MNLKNSSLTSVFWRLTLVVGVIATSLAAIGEIRLRFECNDHVELSAETLSDQTTLEPVWASVSDFVAAGRPVLVTSETGKARGAYLPLAAPSAPDDVVAVLATEDMSAARALYQRGSGLAIDGLYVLPSLRTRQFLNKVLHEEGLKSLGVVRMVEPGGAPMRVVSLAGLLLATVVLGFLLVRATPHPREWAAAAWLEEARGRWPLQEEEDFNLTLPPRVHVHTTEDEVDDFERQVLVEEMVDEVWHDAARQVRRSAV